MHSLKFLEINKRVWIEEKLGECKRDHYLDMAKLIFFLQTGETSYNEFRTMALYVLMDMEYKKEEFENSDEEKWQNIYICSELIDSFFEKDENKVPHLILDFIHNPVKSVKYLNHTFKGPKDSFDGCTYGQIEDGFGELENFKKTNEIEYLVRLFAIFYMRSNETYDKIDLEKRISFFKHLDIRYIYGFYLLFVSFVNYLTKECVILLDGKEIEICMLFNSKNEDLETSEEEIVESIGLRATSFQLAESNVFGPYEDVRKTDYMLILIRMCDLIYRARHEKKEMERIKAESQTSSND